MIVLFGLAPLVRPPTHALPAQYAQCGLRMSLDGSALVIEGQLPAAYKVLVNGSQVWPCPECIERGRLAVLLGGPFAEVEVSRESRRWLYVVRLSNGTYAFAWDGKFAKSVCIS